MAPAKSKKRVSDRSTAQPNRAGTKVQVKSPSTPTGSSPMKVHMGLSAQQKQALIDNLQLEITERARRLRAQYQLQAQGLRTRIEIRINRIPMALRKLKLGDLLQKCAEQEQGRTIAKPPPFPAKDTTLSSSQRGLPVRAPTAGRGFKRMSNEISGDKENEVEHAKGIKKRARVHQADTVRVRPNQVLSPTSSNSRLANRERPASPMKSSIARPGSPLKSSGTSRPGAAANILSGVVEKAKPTRARGTRKMAYNSESSSSNGTTAASRARRNGAAMTSRAPASRPATRNGRRASNTSEISQSSADLEMRKANAAKASTSTAKSTVMGSIRKGVAGGARKAATKYAATPASTTGNGRVLRKRG